MAKILIVYYSSTGHTYQMAKAFGEGAESVGAEVRLRRVAEIAPDAAIDSRPGWREHLNATAGIPEAKTEDLDWADGFLFGTPTRFGLPAAQLKQFSRSERRLMVPGKTAGQASWRLWRCGQCAWRTEATLLALNNVFYHWGSIIVPTGFTSPSIRAAGAIRMALAIPRRPDAKDTAGTPRCGHFQGQRVGRYAEVVAARRSYLSGKAE